MKECRGFYAFLMVGFLFISVFAAQQVWGAPVFKCGDGEFHSWCNDYGGWECLNKDQDGKKVVLPYKSICSEYGGTVDSFDPVCGDDYIDPGEVCDNGGFNSDSVPNACRTDCRAAYCGDSVVDPGEECDSQFGDNSNNPNSCRPGCTLPVCGDGIHDDGSYETTVFNEGCDDGNTNNLDGCKADCTTCLRLVNNIEVTTDTRLCGDVFNVADYADEGVIIVKFPGVTIDCDGATLIGTGKVDTAGILVKMSDGVKIKDCTISGYAAGVKAVNSQNLLIVGSSNLSGNTKDVVLENNSNRSYEKLSPEAPGNLKPVVKPVQPKLLTAQSQAQVVLSAPVVVYPRSNQSFFAPAGFVAKVSGKSRERFVFTVKNVGGKRFQKQANDGRFVGIPAGEYCVEAAPLKNPGSPGACVRFKVSGSLMKLAPAKPLIPATTPTSAKPRISAKAPALAPSPASPRPAVSKVMALVVPKGTVVTEGKRTFLNLNVSIARAEVYAGTRRLGKLPGGKRLEVTNYVSKALRGELVFHYFDARGSKTIQKVRVGSGRK